MSAGLWTREEREAILKHARPLAGRDRSADALIKAAATVEALELKSHQLANAIRAYLEEKCSTGTVKAELIEMDDLLAALEGKP